MSTDWRVRLDSLAMWRELGNLGTVRAGVPGRGVGLADRGIAGADDGAGRHGELGGRANSAAVCQAGRRDRDSGAECQRFWVFGAAFGAGCLLIWLTCCVKYLKTHRKTWIRDGVRNRTLSPVPARDRPRRSPQADRAWPADRRPSNAYRLRSSALTRIAAGSEGTSHLGAALGAIRARRALAMPIDEAMASSGRCAIARLADAVGDRGGCGDRRSVVGAFGTVAEGCESMARSRDFRSRGANWSANSRMLALPCPLTH